MPTLEQNVTVPIDVIWRFSVDQYQPDVIIVQVYAAAEIPVYWIVNLLDRQIEVYTEPSGPAEKPDYRQQQNYSLADTIPVVIETREVGRLSVQDLLP